jgi:hypothetical protein
MCRLLQNGVIAIAVAFTALLIASPGQTADLNVNNRHVSRSDCGPSGCRRHRIIYRCPDSYSCYPLYGAYGPYGGEAYWGAYTFSYR